MLSNNLDDRKFRPYLEILRFELFTHNSALTWLHRDKHKNSKLTWWSLQLSNLDFSTVHARGKLNDAPDLLSRDPTPGGTLDEDIFDEKLVGVSITPPTQVRPKTKNLFSTFENHDNHNQTISVDILAHWQSEDPATCNIISNITDDVPARNTRSGKNRIDTYVFSEGLLRTKIGPDSLVVIFRSKTKHIIWRYHDHFLSNHPGWRETYRAVRQRFYWKGQRNDVRLYVNSCHICACTKPLNTRPDDPIRTRIPKQPWEAIIIDLMGPYPRTSRGKTCILVVTDCFSRWTEAYPLGTATTKIITETLEREFFSRYGFSRVYQRQRPPVCLKRNENQVLDRWGTEGWTTPSLPRPS